MNRKPLLVVVVFIIVIVVVGFLVFSDIGTRALEWALGNSVYALTVSYVPSLGGLGDVKFDFDLDLFQTRVPVEAVPQGFSVEVVSPSSFDDSNFSLTLYVSAVVGNNIPVCSRSFSFQDGKRRVVTCYLMSFDSGKYPESSASVWGSYVYDGHQYPISTYGGKWSFESQ